MYIFVVLLFGAFLLVVLSGYFCASYFGVTKDPYAPRPDEQRGSVNGPANTGDVVSDLQRLEREASSSEVGRGRALQRNSLSSSQQESDIVNQDDLDQPPPSYDECMRNDEISRINGERSRRADEQPPPQ